MPDTVEVGSDDYFDPKATDPQWPNILGLNMRVHHWWQGDDAWDTYDVLGTGPNSLSLGVGSRAQGQQGEARGGDGISHDNTISIPMLDPDHTTPPPDAILNSADYVNGMLLTPCIDEDGMGLFGIEGEAIQIWLEGLYNYQVEGLSPGQMVFPIPPEELSADFPTDNDFDTDVIGIGEITIPGTEKLESIGWSSFFPRDYDASYVTIPFGWMPRPEDAIIALIQSKRQRLPLRLTIGGTVWNDDVIIKTLKWTVKAGEPGDIYYDIQFKRYRTTVVNTIAIPRPPVGSDTLTNPMNDRGGLPATTSPAGSVGDGTQVNAVAPAPLPGQPGFIGPSHNTVAETIGPQPVDRWIISSTQAEYTTGITTHVFPGYSVGAPSSQSITDVYESIIREGNGDKNTLESLKADNKDREVSPISSPISSSTGFHFHKIGEYADSEPLPPGTVLIYQKVTKVHQVGNRISGTNSVTGQPTSIFLPPNQLPINTTVTQPVP